MMNREIMMKRMIARPLSKVFFRFILFRFVLYNSVNIMIIFSRNE